MNWEYFNGPASNRLYVNVAFDDAEIQDIPLPNYKALVSQLDKAEASGRTSEVLRVFADMAKTLENIQDGDEGRT